MKMERFNEILNKLMQMEDAEENLEMVMRRHWSFQKRFTENII